MHMGGPQAFILLQKMKMDFPRFDGEDPMGRFIQKIFYTE